MKKSSVVEGYGNSVKLLEAFDRFSDGIQQLFDMPKSTITLLHKFLIQGNGQLIQPAKVTIVNPECSQQIRVQ